MNGYGCTSIFSKTYKMHPEKKPALETPSTATTRIQRGELLSPEQPQGAF